MVIPQNKVQIYKLRDKFIDCITYEIIIPK